MVFDDVDNQELLCLETDLPSQTSIVRRQLSQTNNMVDGFTSMYVHIYTPQDSQSN